MGALASGRSPLTVICSVDRSGSMAGEKLKLTMATLRFLVSQLAATDKFGLVVWDDTVQTQFSPALMDEKGKQSALEAIKQVRAGATTNLSGGLLQGLSEAISDPDLAEPGRTSSVLLFTDGLANRGLTDSAKIAGCMKGALEDCSDNQPSIFTFGFGEDHDAEMLRTIADVGEGLYYYIENKESIPQTFADCLGGLLSVVAQNMVLVVEPCDGVSILKVHSKVPTKNLNDEGGPETQVFRHGGGKAWFNKVGCLRELYECTSRRRCSPECARRCTVWESECSRGDGGCKHTWENRQV